MFRHQGKSRTVKHNIRIAVLLSFIAGMVNITGFFGIHRLTTNVTGHFATLIRDVYAMDWAACMVYIAYLLSFLVGSFTSSILIEWMSLRKRMNIYVLPTLVESVVLLIIPFMVYSYPTISPNIIACLLLFAMGVQNSFVTKISNAVVRTTHLTGLFTDLGIELSQLFFPSKKYFYKNESTIKLRLNIILCFFLGGIVGGFLFAKIDFFVLTVGVIILLVGLILDNVRYKMIRISRKYKTAKN